MFRYLSKSIVLLLFSVIILCVIYPGAVWVIGQVFFPFQANGSLVKAPDGTVVGSRLIAQPFTKDEYFCSRPSAVNYAADGSGGSNKGPTNPDYLKDVEKRIRDFMKRNPGVSRAEIPAELVTASGSGLDPDLSPAGAKVQVARIARARGISADKINSIIEATEEQPLLGLFGPAKVNVLKLNVALDELKSKN